MRFGVCGDMKLGSVAAQASYDYMEWSVAELLRPLKPEDAFREACEMVSGSALPYEVANCFVPTELKITGPDADMSALEAYVRTTMARAEQIGLKVIVFGSGDARRIPEGFDRQRAHEQIVVFCRMVGPIAQAHGVTIAVEPLNKADCNVLNTVAECAGLVNEVDHPAIRLLVDAYHMMRDGDAVRSIEEHGHLLTHVHIATIPNRLAPAAEDCQFADFFGALAKAQYNGRVSIEAKINNPETELPAALLMMRKLSNMGMKDGGTERCR